jgi:hypothetical protein
MDGGDGELFWGDLATELRTLRMKIATHRLQVSNPFFSSRNLIL